MSIDEKFNSFDENNLHDEKFKFLELNKNQETSSTSSTPFPPSPDHLPGCSPSYFTCISPFKFTEQQSDKMEDKILHENEKQVVILAML